MEWMIWAYAAFVIAFAALAGTSEEVADRDMIRCIVMCLFWPIVLAVAVSSMMTYRPEK